MSENRALGRPMPKKGSLFLERYVLGKCVMLVPKFVSLWHARDAHAATVNECQEPVALLFLTHQTQLDFYVRTFRSKATSTGRNDTSMPSILHWHEWASPGVMHFEDGSVARMRGVAREKHSDSPALHAKPNKYAPFSGNGPLGRRENYSVVLVLPRAATNEEAVTRVNFPAHKEFLCESVLHTLSPATVYNFCSMEPWLADCSCGCAACGNNTPTVGTSSSKRKRRRKKKSQQRRAAAQQLELVPSSTNASGATSLTSSAQHTHKSKDSQSELPTFVVPAQI